MSAFPEQGAQPWPGPRQIGAAALILDTHRGVLLVKHTYGKFNWELPGGLSEAGESAEATAVREVLEEVGLTVRVERLVGVYFSEPSDMHHFMFRCAVSDGREDPKPSSLEISEIGFFGARDLPRPISDFTIKRIEDGLAERRVAGVTVIGPRVWFESE